jgi:IS6 family transposase
VIDALVSTRRDGAAARAFFLRALRVGPAPVEVTTDRAPPDPRIIEELVPAARHVTERYANNVVEADTDGSRRGCGRCADLKSTASARMIAAGDGFVQNPRRGHYPVTADVGDRRKPRVQLFCRLW